MAWVPWEAVCRDACRFGGTGSRQQCLWVNVRTVLQMWREQNLGLLQGVIWVSVILLMCTFTSETKSFTYCVPPSMSVHMPFSQTSLSFSFHATFNQPSHLLLLMKPYISQPWDTFYTTQMSGCTPEALRIRRSFILVVWEVICEWDAGACNFQLAHIYWAMNHESMREEFLVFLIHLMKAITLFVFPRASEKHGSTVS